MLRTISNPTAANTLNLSTIPKYCLGTAPVPIAPINIMAKAIAAQIAVSIFLVFLKPPTIMSISETIEVTTTAAVITYTCIMFWKPLISFPALESGNISYPILDIQFIMANRYIPVLNTLLPAFITETTKLRLFGKVFVRYGKPVTMDELTEGWTEESGIERLQYAVEALKVKILELENKDYR